MATNFDNAILLSDGFIPTRTNTPLDKRTRIDSIDEMSSIPNPFVGMIVYVSGEDKYYKIKTLKSKVISGITVKNAQVDSYEVFESGGSSSIAIDDSLSDSSTNPVQNKVIKEELDKKAAKTAIPSLDGYATTQEVNTAINKVKSELNSDIEGNSSDISDLQSSVGTLSVKVSALSGIDSPFVGYFDSAGKLPVRTEPAWALVGDLATAKPYAYYVAGNVPSGYAEGWNDLSGVLGTYDFTDLKEYFKKISMVYDSNLPDGGYYDIGSVGGTATLNFTSQPQYWKSGIFKCSEGDILYIKGTGGNTARLYGFIDSNNVVLSAATESQKIDNLTAFVAPAGTDRVVVNTSLSNKNTKVYINGSRIADIESEVENLKDGNNIIIQLYTKGEPSVPSFTDGGFVNAEDGTIIASNDYKGTYMYSDYIEIPTQTKVEIFCYYQNRAGLALYNEQKNFIIGYKDSGFKSRILGPYSGKRYIRISTTPSNKNLTTVTSYIVGEEKPLTELLNDLSDSSAGNKKVVINDDADIFGGISFNFAGWVNSEDGTVDSTNSYYRNTDYIEVVPESKIAVLGQVSNRAGIAFYDENRQYISGKNNYKISGIQIFTVPNGAKYLRATTDKAFLNDSALAIPESIQSLSLNDAIEYFDEKELKSSIIKGESDADINSILIVGSSSIQKMEEITGNNSLDSLSQMPVRWSGVGGENMKAVTARLGSEAIVLSKGFTIPPGTTSVEMGTLGETFSVRGGSINFSTQQGSSLPKLNPVYIQGIKGNITVSGNSYIFTRVEAGEQREIYAGDVVIPENVMYRNYILVGALGYNGGYSSLDDYMDYHRKALLFCQSKKFLFMSRLVDDGNWDVISEKLKGEEDAMLLEYGNNFLNVRKWLSDYGIEYAVKLGLLDGNTYPTAQDIADKENGCVPHSLRLDTAHLTQEGYSVLNHKIAEMLTILMRLSLGI